MTEKSLKILPLKDKDDCELRSMCLKQVEMLKRMIVSEKSGQWLKNDSTPMYIKDDCQRGAYKINQAQKLKEKCSQTSIKSDKFKNKSKKTKSTTNIGSKIKIVKENLIKD